jgi:hypothetical protein
MLLQILTLFLIVDNQEDSLLPPILLYFVGVFSSFFLVGIMPPLPPQLYTGLLLLSNYEEIK